MSWIEYWPGDAQIPAQIVFGSREGSLFSIAGSTGKPNEAFGDKGIVNLSTPEILRACPKNNARVCHDFNVGTKQGGPGL